MEDDLDTVLTAVGPRLRALRRKRNITLADLSEITGISTSTLSRLESGQRKPTLELLLPLAQAYHVPLDELVGAPATGDPRIHTRPIHRDGRVFIPLTREATGIQAFKLILPGSKPGDEIEKRTHEGYEWFYVLAGKVRLLLGDNDLVLKAGEAAEFDTRVPHRFASATSKPAELLALFGPQGERAHVRASTTKKRAPVSDSPYATQTSAQTSPHRVQRPSHPPSR